MTALAGKKCDFYLTAGASVPITANEPMQDISASVPGALARTVYQVTNPVKRYFDLATPLVIQISLNSGGSWATANPDNVDPMLISFVAQQQAAPPAQFRVLSGNYLPWGRVAGGHEWTVTPQIALVDSTEFMQTSKHHTAIPLSDGTVQVKRFYLDDSVRSVLGGKMIAVLFVDASAQPAGPRWEGAVMLKSDAIKVPVAGVEEEDLTLQIDGDIYYLST